MTTEAFEYRAACDAGGTAPAQSARGARIVARVLDDEHPDHGPHRAERRRIYTDVWELIPVGDLG